jgi:hypothetical protein
VDIRIASQMTLLYRSRRTVLALTVALERGGKPLTYVYVLT